jgi:voltage-gated potassium channel
MVEPLKTPAPAGDPRQTWEDRLAGPMFFLALAFLVVLAGLIHRYARLGPDDWEASVIQGGLGILWVVFLLEAAVRFWLRDRGRPAWQPLMAASGLLPPLRMGCRSQVRPNHLWLPVLGWQRVDAHLRNTLERFFSVPMLVFAFMVLPLFVLEFYWAENVHAEPALALALDIGTAVIWLAFTVELIIMVAVADRPVRYCFSHWIDVAIVLLPAVEVLPLFRLLRLGRVLRLDQFLRWGRLHRLKAVALRGWRAVLLLQIVERLAGRSPEGQLKQLEELLKAKEEEVADLRQEVKELEGRIALKAMSRQEKMPSAQGGERRGGATRARSKPVASDAGIASPVPSC